MSPVTKSVRSALVEADVRVSATNDVTQSLPPKSVVRSMPPSENAVNIHLFTGSLLVGVNGHGVGRSAVWLNVAQTGFALTAQSVSDCGWTILRLLPAHDPPTVGVLSSFV